MFICKDFYFICMNIYPACVSVHHMCASPSQEGVGSPGTGITTVENCPMWHAGNQTLVLYKTSMCS